MSTATCILLHKWKERTARQYASSLECFHLNTRIVRNVSSHLEWLLLEIGVYFDEIMPNKTWRTHDTNVSWLKV